MEGDDTKIVYQDWFPWTVKKANYETFKSCTDPFYHIYSMYKDINRTENIKFYVLFIT